MAILKSNIDRPQELNGVPKKSLINIFGHAFQLSAFLKVRVNKGSVFID